ncbi:MAG: tripartite tricarboxylate transporter substrate binding protein [Betaproteobacteria bacterium]|nr:tripartite tricarboxylate transporter substrate binding protein [Betaproteobacteria bacterium]
MMMKVAQTGLRLGRLYQRGLHLLWLLLAAWSVNAHGQAFPSKPIRVVVPIAPGGAGDSLTRILAQRLTSTLGQQVIVENRTGAGGQIGAELVSRSPADGYTLLLGTIGIHAAYGIYTKLSYNPAQDLQPVILLGESPNIFVVHPSLPVKTVKEFIALAKSRPGKINFGSAGTGSTTHMVGELFKLMAKVDLTHVPYKGTGPALSALLGGHIESLFPAVTGALAHIATGKLLALGTASKARLPSLPNVPTVTEAGVPGYEAGTWLTFAAPSKVPAAIIQKLNTEINDILKSAETEAQLLKMGIMRLGGSPEEAAKHIVAETEKWNKVIKASNLRSD